LTHDVRIASEISLPEGVTEDHRLCANASMFIGRKRPSNDEPSAEESKEITADLKR
jgi:hypothetical protein